ncbi:MAG: 3'(2'),5'-bisphosphate nucleotidase CysQ [Proteobacteria bacterium]|nr:3'(2'),5'-bisphosphate nucleotidase CysQ [Pseudomonadota bacterium]
MEASNVPVIDAQTAVALMDPLTELVVQAGAAILAVKRDRMAIGDKADGSPVTEADMASDRIIADGLARLCPDIPVLSEERVHLATPPYAGSFFVIDPLDGTKEFIAGRDEFTINLAMVTDGIPQLGIIGAPALGLIWRGLVGHGAQRLSVATGAGLSAALPIKTRPCPNPGSPWIAAVSRSHGDSRSEAFIDSRPGAVRKALGSAVKFCRIAEGGADIYPRLAPTGEWDVAAGHALVVAAGGKITDGRGAPLRFGESRDGFLVPEFIAWGDPSAAP